MSLPKIPFSVIDNPAPPYVVLIVTQDKNGQELALGSGFIVKDGLIATNGHVIEGAAHGYVKLVDQKPKFDIAGVVASDPDHDLVLQSVKDVTGQPLPLARGDVPKIGDGMFAEGNPRGLEGTFSEGIVSTVRIRRFSQEKCPTPKSK